jgi:tRNA (guanine26-N2/guanine27-N2)-dimethyltransferase
VGISKEPQAIKTDAPSRIVWDVMRAWCKQNPPKISKKKQKKMAAKLREGTVANNADDAFNASEEGIHEKSTADKILEVEPSIVVDFTVTKGKGDYQKKVTRFPMNPTKNWGPKKAASGKRKLDEMTTTATTEEDDKI